jgi:dinuclear metal center YbgI/SA1388 family protein
MPTPTVGEGMDLADFADRLDDLLDVDDLDGLDYAVNGLQVGAEDATVEHAAFAVDGVELTFEEAADRGADVLVVHHGVSWGGIDRVTGKEYDRLDALLSNDLALYAVHLPLDAHREYGNAARLAEFLGLDVTEGFGREGPATVGVRASAGDPHTVDSLTERLETLENDSVQVLAFGPDRIEDVGIITGSGTDWLDEAREKGLDALVTGEGKQPAYHEAREAGIHVFLAGHYATETFGVRALQDEVGGWDEGIETSYIEHPTGL